MRYRNAWMLTIALLAAACKPTAPVAEAADGSPVVAPIPTVASSDASSEKKSLAPVTITAGFAKEMPYATLRRTLLDAGWLPLRDPMCRENVGGEARVCGVLPETESCSGDGHCLMHFASASASQSISVSTYGPYDRWNVTGEESTFAVQSWALSPLQTTKASDSAPQSCPSHDFDSFLKAFAADERIKQAFTAPVVKVAELGGGEDGDDTVFVYVLSSNYTGFNVGFVGNAFHYIDASGSSDAAPLDLKVQSQGKNTRDVSYFYGMSEGNSYRFEERDGCWYLTEDPDPPSP